MTGLHRLLSQLRKMARFYVSWKGNIRLLGSEALVQADNIYVICILVIEFTWIQAKTIRNMKFCCSKIRINGKEVIKSGLHIWEEVGVEKGWYKRKEKEDQKKIEKG